jgi:hypothetical protein
MDTVSQQPSIWRQYWLHLDKRVSSQNRTALCHLLLLACRHHFLNTRTIVRRSV